MNLRKFASEVAREADEPVATVSKILRVILIKMGRIPPKEAVDMVYRYRPKDDR